MKNKKTIPAVLTIVLVIFSLTGCSLEGLTNPEIQGEKKSKELLQYLSENDAEGLKSMFCAITQSSDAFDKQRQEAIDFFEGEITSDEPHILVNNGRAVDDGKTTRLDIAPHITGIETDASKTYEIIFSSYLINTEYEDKVGISELSIESDDGAKCVVGEYIR